MLKYQAIFRERPLSVNCSFATFTVCMHAVDSFDQTLGGLVADVGGTNARFGWVSPSGAAVDHVRQYPVAQSASLAAAAEHYLSEIGPAAGMSPARPLRPARVALALATALDGDEVRMTNSNWSFSRRELADTLGLRGPDELVLLNDFEALALSLPHLRSRQWSLIPGSPEPQAPTGTLAVIGPGTGLGVAGVVQTPLGWQALPGEGGHATLAPADDFESEVLGRVRRHFSHVSAERVLSGIGLPVLHQAVGEVTGHAQRGPEQAAAIVEAAHAGEAWSLRTVEVFCALLGGFCGSVALTLGARGGVYIGGGIVPRLGPLFTQSLFRERFEAKGRFREYLQPIATVVITDTLAALDGAAAALRSTGR